ncbi:MAG: succinate--CoA ligase, partial [Desulfitobacterium hafniense]|nr:succinate--CoA ligase [Desulfitobacterium hafniense]
VMAGGRGKAGLILPATDSTSAEKVARTIFGKVHAAEEVTRVLVEEQLQIKQEAYASVTMDFSVGKPVVMVSAHGGIDIETVAVTNPELLVKEYLEPWETVFSHKLREMWYQAGYKGQQIVSLEEILKKLVKVFYETDAITAEINPLVIMESGEVIAADAKLIIDEEAAFRHKGLVVVPREENNLFEKRAKEINVSYVALDPDGTVGIVAGGAGLSMATMDAVYSIGSKPVAFIDLGGGISRDRMKETLSLMAQTPGLKGVIINVFGGINNCLTMAQGLADFIDAEKPELKIVVKMRGHEQEEGWSILERYHIPTVKFGTTDIAIRELIKSLEEAGTECAS